MSDIISNFTTLKDGIIADRDNLKNILIEKGSDCSNINKISELIPKVSDFRSPIPSWMTSPPGWSEEPTNRSVKDYHHTSSAVNGLIYCIGGTTNQRRVDCYNPTTNEWTTKTSPPNDISEATSQAVGDNIYCIGGFLADTAGQNLCYNTTTDTWTSKKVIPKDVYGLSSTVLNGLIYCLGGIVSDSAGSIHYYYNPSTNTWTSRKVYPKSVWGNTLDVVNGLIYSVGGMIDGNEDSYVYCYNPTSNTWTSKTLRTQEVAFHASATDNKNLIYTFAGRSSVLVGHVYRYNVSADEWEQCVDMLYCDDYVSTGYREWLTATNVNNVVYCIGGYKIKNNTSTDVNEAFVL